MTSVRAGRGRRGLVVSSALALVLVPACAGGGTGGHSLAGPPPNGFAMRQPVGHVFTDGQLTVRNTGSRPVTIKRVEPALTGDGLQYLGAYIAGPERESASIQYYEQFPPSDPTLGRVQEAEGAVLDAGQLPAERGYELLLGFRVRGEGRTTRTAVRITYNDGGGDKTLTAASTIAVCAPEPGPECDPEYGDS